MITKFSKLNARQLGLDIAAALQEVGKRHGIAIEYAGGTVGDVEFVCKVRCKVNDAASIETSQRQDFSNNCAFFNMTVLDYGKEIELNGSRLRLIGFTSRTKFPVRVFDITKGKEMLYGESILARFRTPMTRPSLAAVN